MAGSWPTGSRRTGASRACFTCSTWTPGAHLPDRIPRMRAAALAWLPDGSAFYYTRYPAPDEVPEGEEHYHRAIYFHRLGTDPAARPAGLPAGREGVLARGEPLSRRPLALDRAWPARSIRPISTSRISRWHGRWCRSRRTCRRRSKARSSAAALPAHQPGCADLPAVRGRPGAAGRERLARDRRRRGRRGTRSVAVPDERLASELPRASLVATPSVTDLEGTHVQEVPLPALGSLFGIGAEWDGDELFYGFSSYTVPPSVYRIDLDTGAATLWSRVEADIDPGRYEVRQVTLSPRGTARPSPCSWCIAPGLHAGWRQSRPISPATAGFNISMTPAFSRSLLLWLEHGGVVAIPKSAAVVSTARLASGGDAGKQAEQLRRLHRGSGVADRDRATPGPSGWPSRADRTAGC